MCGQTVMEEQVLDDASPEQAGTQPINELGILIENLEALPDETLHDLTRQAKAILEGRATARRREAVAEIHRLAKENGLAVSIQKPARKRGRPRKADPAAL